MQYVNDAILLIIGSGDVIPALKQIVIKHKLASRVKFIGKIPLEILFQFTQLADIGLTLDKDTNINYRYSLPNKLFDYIHAGVPVLASNLVEVKKIIKHYQIGDCIDNYTPQHIASKLNSMLIDEAQLQIWKKNAKIAAAQLNWEQEELKLLEVYKRFL
jgi:glycosyltransferase involved in cell wall biosynthesis